jgi:hypothetical protein
MRIVNKYILLLQDELTRDDKKSLPETRQKQAVSLFHDNGLRSNKNNKSPFLYDKRNDRSFYTHTIYHFPLKRIKLKWRGSLIEYGQKYGYLIYNVLILHL